MGGVAAELTSVVQRNVKIRNCLEGQTNFAINSEGMARRKLFAYLNLRAPVVGALELRKFAHPGEGGHVLQKR